MLHHSKACVGSVADLAGLALSTEAGDEGCQVGFCVLPSSWEQTGLLYHVKSAKACFGRDDHLAGLALSPEASNEGRQVCFLLLDSGMRSTSDRPHHTACLHVVSAIKQGEHTS